jgi:oligopeptide transport system ATP-binding protein
MVSQTPLLEVRGLSKSFPGERDLLGVLAGRKAGALQAVRDVSFMLEPGETLGIVGESGCGKSTLGRCIAGIHQPTGGEILWQGAPLERIGDRKAQSRRIQMIFQDPYSSLNPRMTIGDTVAEALLVHGVGSSAAERKDRVDHLLSLVGLPTMVKDRLPHALSGGQRQRVSIARALAVEPQLIVADEPVSALDASVQAQIINLFEELREKLGVAFIFIAHDLNVVRHISHRVAVMYLGQIVEIGPADSLFSAPRHPYTRALLSAVPMPDPQQRATAASLEGELPDPSRPPKGCSFSTRCRWVVDRCREVNPQLEPIDEERTARCIRLEEIG